MSGRPAGALTSLTRAIAVVAVAAGPAFAHDGRPLAPHDLWSAWDWNPAVTIPLALCAALYSLGVRRVWTRAARGHGVTRREVVSFALGWITLFVALVS